MSDAEYFVHPTAVVDRPVEIGAGTKIWHFSHVMSGASIGRICNLGQNVFVAGGVRIGDRVKIQNNVSVYAGVELEDDVFCGPSCVFTNVSHPRAEFNRRAEFQRTLVRRGATVGANATILCGTTVGQYAFVGAGAVVTRDAPDYALMIGVPARRMGWVGRHGYRLEIGAESNTLVCPSSGWRYREVTPGVLICVDWPEDQRLEAPGAARS